MNNFYIGKRLIAENEPPYFIADIAANHDGEIERAFKLIELAKEFGADAAKFQHFQAAKIVSKYGFDHLGSKLSHQSGWKKSVFDVYQDASISKNWTAALKEKCDEVEIDFFTSPYDKESVDHVDPFLDVYKIGSGDITWTEILEYIAGKDKPVLLASGASTMEDVDRAVKCILAINPNMALMQCNTNYTTDADKHRFVNLNVLKTFKKKYPNLILGLSDHTPGHATILGAVALGARVFEKHFTDDNARIGPDHKFAMNPKSWRNMVDNGMELYQSLGDGIKRVEENELDSITVQRRSLVATDFIKAGTVLLDKHIEALRPIPDGAIPPYKKDELIGKKMLIDLEKGDHFSWTNFI